MSFWQRNLAAARLAWIQQFEYRFNLFVDIIFQPVLTAAFEITLWWAMISSIGDGAGLAGFSKTHYLHYALWAAFFARISVNWMYEFRMTDDIQSGAINVILSRPLSFYQFYLSQFLSYKILTALLSLLVPAAIVSFFFHGPTDLSRLPLSCLAAFEYLILVYHFSFIVATFAFRLNKVGAITIAKNLAVISLTGELFPIDLAPTWIKNILLNLPFVGGVYIPVGYLTGRCDLETLLNTIGIVSLWILGSGLVAMLLWRRSIKNYSGTGA